MCDEGETADRADAVRTESQKMESRAGETALDGSARSIIVLIVVGMFGGCAVRHVRHWWRHGDRARARLAGSVSAQRGRHVHAGDRADRHFRRCFLCGRRECRLACRGSAVLRHVRRRTGRQLAALAVAGIGAAVVFS
mgnify:CR=1 FL=1